MELKELNEKFGEAEKAKDLSFFEQYMSDNMIFRRAAPGVIDTKEIFLRKLDDPDLIYKSISTKVTNVAETGSHAIVRAIVAVDMVNHGDAIQGSFDNLRVFEKSQGDWKLLMWFNRKLE